MAKQKSVTQAELVLPDKKARLPIFEGTEAERAIDITKLRAETAYITFDPSYANTGSCMSRITFIDGEKGVLRYRGIPIEELAAKSTFLETSYLLIYGKLPTRRQLEDFTYHITHHSMIHEDMKRFFHGFPQTSHPMSILSSMICSLSSFYPDSLYHSPKTMDLNIYRLLSKVITIAAFAYKKTVGQRQEIKKARSQPPIKCAHSNSSRKNKAQSV